MEKSFSSKDQNYGRFDVYQIRGDNNGTSLFEFLADNTKVEWSQMKFGIEGNKGLNVLTTSHMEGTEYGSSSMLFKQFIYGYTMREDIHRHPHNTPKPSGFGKDEGTGDMEYARYIQGVHPNVRLKIYLPKTKSYIEYNKNSSVNDF